jgi:hypothetical protein
MSIHPVMADALKGFAPEAATNERTILDGLYEARRGIWAEQAELRARGHEIEEQIAKLTNDPTGAEWHRLSVIAERSGKPEDSDAAHRAWVHDMAVHLLKQGRRPDVGGHCQPEIDEEMDRLSAGTVQ